MESNSTWSFMSGFFHWAWCIPDSSMLWFVAVVHSFLWLNNTLLYTYTTFHFSVAVLFFNDAFTLGLLWTMLLWTFMYKILHGHVNSFICHIYLGVELWNCWSYGNSMYNLFRNYQELFEECYQSVCTILHFHQQCVRVPISPHVTNVFYYLPFWV